ncbi:glucose-1-phosphate adenylyltransferase subunit GlgD [Alkalihalophilus pseudofirmus]|uniref:Glucose-1-phosphate adenylyltransferase subunit GlgD n=1 Tax=Alkalihalophilus pseudofirmus TaxID=79885 RepID=A0AAJ2NQM4_ALKPS|nr:glucose-1-phosphate adenylyltransferase subunit GlgD [Alkalihalophilus pseudofirmus]MDV2886835.1 glucose-1-phosphate adenylyltransferase subunit GlgD [Alkalihalophilus pseudofirmus]
MKRLMGVINLDAEQDLLGELTYFRCGAAVPFGGRYRLIDFVLSNMVHAQISEIAVFTRRKYRSLMDHLGNGKAWDLDHVKGGLFILPPDWNDPTDISKGELQHFHNNRDFFARGQADHVLITGSQHVSTVDFEEVFTQHLNTNADVTVVYQHNEKMVTDTPFSKKLTIDKTGHVRDLTNDQKNPNYYMNMYIIKKDLLLELVDSCIARGKSFLFEEGIIPRADKLKIGSYAYNGYLAVIDSLSAYYQQSMKLLSDQHFEELFLSKKPLLTKIKNEPPTVYKRGSNATNSLIANGCVIEGKVSNSILFRGVKVERGAVIENSVIMQRCVIKKGTVLKNVVLDKDITLTPNKTLIGADKQPYVLAKRKVI